MLLVVIGPNWATCTDDEGRRRLEDPNDYVRLEVQSALAKPDLRVIPVLVGDAKMPSASSLPSTLEPLTRRNATILLDELWRPSLAQLIEVLERIRDELATSVAGTAAPVVASSPLGDVPVQSIEGAGAAGRTPFDRTSRHETGDRATNESDATSARSSDLADGSIAHEHQAESPGRSSHPRGSADRPKRRPWKLIAVISSPSRS